MCQMEKGYRVLRRDSIMIVIGDNEVSLFLLLDSMIIFGPIPWFFSSLSFDFVV
ncbi:uncharacterized protein BDW47DRAFT_113545 [Aspergillus candidus]|uniref:Uncharacterized protein n=1 Tax=Aspergillus candidus TaxID=41067 RepID=A0A2I2EZ83_ASPCN|nr:hypothetical protein BDW47DRAFT_113545 [Aspergillus candidus]PLB33687.1 hypothetical protein BDW47DRAFT_113545 [Aspergillus candidus]